MFRDFIKKVHTSSVNLSRLKGRKSSEFLLRRGNVWKGRTMVVRWLPGHPRNVKDETKRAIYVGTMASAKLHKSAVKRNRMRRRCREALRIAVRECDNIPTVQLLIAPRSSSLDCAYADIQTDVRTFLTVITPHG